MIINLAKPSLHLNVSQQTAPLAVVVSHERSGTHFLMNSLAINSDYSIEPYVNFDLDPCGDFVNFYSSASVCGFFDLLSNLNNENQRLNLKSLIKSHHSVEFFEPVLSRSNIRFLYVYRHPAETLLSLWRFLLGFEWHEGLKANCPLDLALSAPEGQLTRYQYHAAATHFERWAKHVSGWLLAAKFYENVRCINYADLSSNFQDEVPKLLKFLESELPATFLKPDRDHYLKGVEKAVTQEQMTSFSEYVEGQLALYDDLARLFKCG